MKIKEDRKYHGSRQHSCASSNGTTLDQIDAVDLELQKAFEGENCSGSCNKKHDSISPTDTIAFNIEGIQTVVKNNQDPTEKINFANGVYSENLLLAEIQRYKEENVQLRAALKEASKVNHQWRNYHEQRQGYVQKLLSSLQDLQQSTSSTQEEGKSSMEFQRLKEMFSRQQKEHNEHVQLLQLQVRAHRDDWEAERTEKKAAEIGRIQAEAHLQILQRQLKEAANALAEMDARLKLCKCFAASVRDQISPNERRSISSSFPHHNGQIHSNECRASQSTSSTPTFSSANSSCNSTSRSSSVSKDFSTSSSPTISKNIQSVSSCGQNSEANRTISPSMRLHISRSTSKGNESQDKAGFEKPGSASHNYTQLEEISSRGTSKSYCTDQNSTSKPKSKERVDALTENALRYYESKGARPKVPTGRGSDEEERKAKHRARSILASALPMSPSSSKPSSPVTVLSGKCSQVPKGYIPLTSTVMTPTKNKQTQVSSKTTVPKQLFEESSCYHHSTKSESHKNVLGSDGNVNPHHSLCSKTLDKDSKFAQSSTESVLPKFKDLQPKTRDNISNCHRKKDIAGNHCSVQINGIPSHLKDESKNNSVDSSKHQHEDEQLVVNKDFLDVKSACKIKQNSKSLTLANNHHEKLNASYASITVMPSPSSASSSHTHGASTTSSRSSSPGISLTTFALNANGQGVPGAIFFALGPETASKHSSSLNKESSDCDGTDRIINSTWVQITDNENNSKNHTSSTPWRTARAIPSHKLNSVKKPNSQISSKNFPTLPIPEEKTKNCEISLHKQKRHGNKKYSSNDTKHLKIPQQNYEIRCHSSFSPPPSYTKCSRETSNNSVTSNQHLSDNIIRNGSSPTICITPNVISSKHGDDAELRTMASRNISSAILSYECANKGSANSQVTNNKEMHQSGVNSDMQEDTASNSVETQSEHCLICPSCQKLFIPDENQQYKQHMKTCCGPRYADM